MTKPTVGIIGAGNMAQALFLPLSSWFEQFDVLVYTPTQTRAALLAKMLGGAVATGIQELNQVDYLILAHKPQQLDQVSSQIRIRSDAKIISLLAAIDIETLKKKLGATSILRLMPNTPAQVGKGVITYSVSAGTEGSFVHWTDALGQFSLVEKVSEEMIDWTTPELGSGPGIVFEIIRLFANSLAQKGIPEERAHELAGMVFCGAGEMVLQTKESPEVLRNNVTSKGGITAECLAVLSDESIEEIFQKSFESGHNRAIEMKQSK